MNSVLYSFVVSGLAGLSTMLGCFCLFFHKSNQKILVGSLSFAAGVMICVSLTDLLPNAWQLFQNVYWYFPAFLFLALFFVVGVIFSMLIDKYLPESPKESGEGHRHLYRIGLISMLAIVLHNIPEGIATFMASSADQKLGLSLALAIALHNIPEGISISSPIYYATGKKGKAFLYTLISGLSEPLGALLAFLFLSPFMNDFIMAILFSFIAGIMIHIATYELLPTSFSYQQKRLSWIFFLIGFLFMFVSHLCFF